MILWAALSAFAEDPRTDDFRSYLDQARFFLRRDWYEDAHEQLVLAVETEDGRIDPEAWFLLAKVRYELCDLAGARFAADRALVNSRDPVQFAQTHDLLAFFEEKFGFVQLVAPYDGVATSLEISLESTIFDPDLKNYFNKLMARLDEPVVLPYNLGLPAGAYLVNGADIVIEAGGQTELAPAIQGAGAARLQVVEVELGLGGTAWLGSAAASLLPAPTTELSVGVPIGHVVLGAMGSWSPQPYQTRSGGLGISPTGYAIGARVGVELPGTQPLVVRPSLTYRLGQVPGVEVACSELEGGWSCAADAEVRQLYIYTSPIIQSAGLELAVLYQDRSRRSGLGAGLKASGDVGFGTFPALSEAQRPEGLVQFEVDDGDRAFRAFGIRMLGTVSYAF